MLTEALDFPTRGDHGSTALLVGSGLLLTSVVFGAFGVLFPPILGGALIAHLAIRGYYVRVLDRSASRSDPDAPAFDDVERLLTDGVIATVVGIVYLIPAALLFLVALGGNLVSALRNPASLDPTAVAAAETVGGLAALFGTLVLLASLYLLPGAVTAYAHERDLRVAFDLRTVTAGTVSEDYAVGWLLTVVLQVVFLPVAFALYPLLIGAFLHFLLAVAVRHVWGRSFGAALGYPSRTVPTEGFTPANRHETEDCPAGDGAETPSAGQPPQTVESTGDESPTQSADVPAPDDFSCTTDTSAEGGVGSDPMADEVDR